MTLTVHNRAPSNVFGLLGSDENSATYSLGWALEHSSEFRRAAIKTWLGAEVAAGQMEICLQKHDQDGGFTDVEIRAGQHFHAILEAKRGWEIPTQQQLRRYHPRFKAAGAKKRCLVSISSADSTYAARNLPITIDGVSVVHQSWGELSRLASAARVTVNKLEEKVWLRHLEKHLRDFAAVDRRTSNMVYVVAIGRDAMVAGGKHTWLDVVEKDGAYFHPIGNRWPVEPVNYIGFRYGGKLRSVHHVDEFAVVKNLASVNPLWVPTKTDHFVYRLGPALRPPVEVRTGDIYKNARVQCAIDTLLSGEFSTIRAARDESKRRLGLLD